MDSSKGGSGSSSTNQGLLILIFPATICAVYSVMASRLNNLVLYTMSGIEYSIGTGGYSINGVQATYVITSHCPRKRLIYVPSDSYSLTWQTPTQWPDIVRRFPKLFIAHLSMAAVTGGYVVIYFGMMIGVWIITRPEYKKGDTHVFHRKFRQIAGQGGPFAFFSLTVLGASLGVAAADVILVSGAWGVGSATRDIGTSFRPTNTGWA